MFINKKRGQLAIFLIMVFVIFTAAAFIYSLNKEEAGSFAGTEIEKEIAIDDINVRNFAESCVTKTAKEALFYLGFIGGGLKPDAFELYYSYDDKYNVPYYYIDGENKIPSPYEEKFWTGLLDKYVNDNLQKCTNNFEGFEGIKVDQGKVISKTEFADDGVIFNVNFPVTIIRDSKANKLDPKYIDGIKVRLRDILKIVSVIVEQEVNNDKYIHWDYLTEVADKNYNITAYTENDNTIVYRIIDLENKIDDEYYYFQWANKIKVTG